MAETYTHATAEVLLEGAFSLVHAKAAKAGSIVEWSEFSSVSGVD
jgi:hypothetical protein